MSMCMCECEWVGKEERERRLIKIWMWMGCGRRWRHGEGVRACVRERVNVWQGSAVIMLIFLFLSRR